MAGSCTTLDLDAFDATRDAVAQDPSVGQGSFTTVTTWEDGARARTTARSFTIETDEPAPLGGTDAAVDPMELVLAAVGTCLNIGWVTQARKRGIDYRDLAHRGQRQLRPARLPRHRRRHPSGLQRHHLHGHGRQRRLAGATRRDQGGRRAHVADVRQRAERHAGERARRQRRLTAARTDGTSRAGGDHDGPLRRQDAGPPPPRHEARPRPHQRRPAGPPAAAVHIEPRALRRQLVRTDARRRRHRRAVRCARTSRTSWSVCVAGTTSAEGERSAPLP